MTNLLGRAGVGVGVGLYRGAPVRNTGFAVGFICISVLFLYVQEPFSVAVIQGCDPRLKSCNLPPIPSPETG